MRTHRQQTFCSTSIFTGVLTGMPIFTIVASLLFTIAVAGCSGVSSTTANPVAQPTAQMDNSAAPSAPLTPPEQPQGRALVSPPTPAQGPHSIKRGALEKVLSQGAQAFISRIRVRPAFRKGKFRGWRIIEYNGPGPILVGDIIQQINDKDIEQPLQVMQVWETLRRSPTLTVKIKRSGEPLTLHYLIED